MSKLFEIKHDNKTYTVVCTIFGISMSFQNYKKYSKKLRKVLHRVAESKQKLAERVEHLSSQNTNLKEKCERLSVENKSMLFKRHKAINSEIESYKEYFLNNNMPDKLQKLKRGLDEGSLKVVEYSLRKMLHLPDRTFRDLFRIDLEKFAEYIEADYEKIGAEICETELVNWKAQYPLSEDKYDIEVLYAHHGLKRANQKILEYIKNKDFIDGGAYIGDSALVLLDYSPSKIYSFEMSEKNCANFLRTMEINNVSPEKYELVKMGILDKKMKLSIDDSGRNCTSLGNQGSCKIMTTDIDSYVFDNNLNVGFIKTDLEGYGLPALNGMAKTIQTFRPVLSMAIYHSPEEFFEIKPRLEEITKSKNYRIHIEHDFSRMDLISGTVIFAYPEELEKSL